MSGRPCLIVLYIVKLVVQKLKKYMCFVWFINECVLIYIFLNFFGKINAYLAGHD